MAKSIDYHNSFNTGEISPGFYGRFDHAKYANAVKFLENFLGRQLGGALFRPGSIYADEVRDSRNLTNLIPFQYSTIQAYIIELGDMYMRFYANKARVESGGLPVEVNTPFKQADIFNLHYAQNADTMYLTHHNYKTQKLIRTSASSFAIHPVYFVRGPFMDTNVTAVTITPSSATGATTLTATIPAWGTGTQYIVNDWVVESAVYYRCLIPHTAGTFATDLANGYWVVDDFFHSGGIYGDNVGHVGSLWKIHSAVVKITSVTNALVAVGLVQIEPAGTAGNIGGTTAYTDWAEGAFSDYRGYPDTVAFHEGRLYYAMGQTIYGSVNYAYDDFESGSDAADAVTFTVNSDQANGIRWIKSNSDLLQMGTSGGTASASGGSTGITPTSIGVKFDTDLGSSTIMAKRISSFIMYLQANNSQLRELVYNYIVNRNMAADMNDLADHILRDGLGVTTFDKQISPNQRIWCVRSDGQLAILTRNPEEQVKGWCRFTGGTSSGVAGLFEAIAVIQKDGSDDEVWVIVKRYINGTLKRFVEYFSPETFVNQWDPVRLDCSLTYNEHKDITGITQATSVVVTAPSHGFSNGMYVRFDLIKGMTELNGNMYIVSDVATNTFKLQKEDGSYIDSTDFGEYVSGGEVRKYVTEISGLDHLEGEDVTVVVDGALPSTQQIYTVSGNMITLKRRAAVVTVGLPYSGTLHLLPTAKGATLKRKFSDVTIGLVKSLGMTIGQFGNDMRRIYFNEDVPAGHPPALFTGEKRIHFESTYAYDPEIIIIQDQPLPLMVLYIVFKSEIEG